MNKKRIITLAGVFIAITLITMATYRIINTMPPRGVTNDEQAVAILENASCIVCHQKDDSSRFFTYFPVLRKKVKNGFRQFNLGDSYDLIKKGADIDEVILAKIEWVTLHNHSMPPIGYQLTHWGTTMTSAKQAILNEWITNCREKSYPNPLAADQHKLEPVRPLPLSINTDTKKIALGKTLFYGTALSAGHLIACASCHQPDNGGANKSQFAIGAHKHLGNINTPSIDRKSTRLNSSH